MDVTAQNASEQPAPARRWYLVQCKPREAFRAREHLANQGYETFLPVLRREVVRRCRREVVTEPLFPHYLFVLLSDIADNWAPLRSTRGVARIVRFGELPLAVPDDLVAGLRTRQVEEGRGEKDGNVQRLLHVGDRVSIIDGPLAGLDAVCAEADGERRVVLLLTLLHQVQRISVDIAQVRRQS